MDLAETIGANVARIRAERGLTQRELAEAAGVHATYIGAIERAERNLSLRAVERLAGRLGVGVRELLSQVPTPAS